MSKVNVTFSAIDCETYFSEGGCGANFLLNILLGGGASGIVNATSDNETGEVRCYIILLQNSRLRPRRNEKVTQPSHGMDGVTANDSYFFNIALESISFLYLYHLTYVNNPGYQASESRNGVGNEFYGRNRRPNFYDILSA